MKIRDILSHKGEDVISVPPDRSVLDAMRVLVAHNIGSVVVLDGTEVVGILTERDVLRLGARETDLLSSTRVEEAMTRDVVIGFPEDDIGYVMEIMTENRIRHLPILEDEVLCGIVSIGDIVNASRTHAESENRYLRDYIRGATR